MTRIFIIPLLIFFCSDAVSQIIYTYAGTGVGGFSGDGGPAISAQIYSPVGIVVDAAGNLYFCDNSNNRVRKINPSGIINTIVGTGFTGFSGDSSNATNALIFSPFGLALDPSGNLFIADQANNRIRMVNTSNIIYTVAGSGGKGYSGDGGSALTAMMDWPSGIAIDPSGNMIIADLNNSRIREVNTSGIINTSIGTGVFGFSGDGGQAAFAQISGAYGVTIDNFGNILVADYYNDRIRKVTPSGTITTIAGTGVTGFSGDGGPATSAQLNRPTGIAVDAVGNIYIADYFNSRIRKINNLGIITTIAGTGIQGYSGDGGLAVSAQINHPFGVAVDSNGNIYFTDTSNNRIRVICPSNCITGVNVTSPISSDIIISPIPNSGVFDIQIDREVKNSKLILSNTLGQKIYEQNIFQGQNKIITQNISKGLYIYTVLLDNGKTETGKLILE